MLPEREPLDADDPGRKTVLDRFFCGLAECIFQSRLGVADVQLVDYLSDLLMRFVRTEGLHRVRCASGKPATEVFQMLREADRRIGLARRDIHRHIGDFTLFWAGMYPESLRKLQRDASPDGLLDYCRQGKRAYRIAAEIEGGEGPPPCELLLRLSEQFELCAYGLREVRREWENSSGAQGMLL